MLTRKLGLDGGGGDLGALFRARHGPEGAAAPAEKLGRHVHSTRLFGRTAPSRPLHPAKWSAGSCS